MKQLQKLHGAKVLGKKEQQVVKGGGPIKCRKDYECYGGWCINGYCAY